MRWFLISCCANQDILAELIAASNILSNFWYLKEVLGPNFCTESTPKFCCEHWEHHYEVLSDHKKVIDNVLCPILWVQMFLRSMWTCFNCVSDQWPQIAIDYYTFTHQRIVFWSPWLLAFCVQILEWTVRSSNFGVTREWKDSDHGSSSNIPAPVVEGWARHSDSHHQEPWLPWAMEALFEPIPHHCAGWGSLKGY